MLSSFRSKMETHSGFIQLRANILNAARRVYCTHTRTHATTNWTKKKRNFSSSTIQRSDNGCPASAPGVRQRKYTYGSGLPTPPALPSYITYLPSPLLS